MNADKHPDTDHFGDRRQIPTDQIVPSTTLQPRKYFSDESIPDSPPMKSATSINLIWVRFRRWYMAASGQLLVFMAISLIFPTVQFYRTVSHLKICGLIVIVFLFFMGFQILVFLGVGGEPLKTYKISPVKER